MAWYAVAALTDAVSLAREFLLPVDLRRWLALAFVVFFIEWGGSTPGGTANAANALSGPATRGADVPLAHLPTGPVAAVGVLVLAVLVVGLGFALIGAVMRFVFIDVLRSGEIAVRQQFSTWLRPGLGLFGFVVLLFLGVVGPVVLLLVAVVLLGFGGPALVFAGLPVMLVIAFVVGLVLLLTYDFVVPTMMHEESGVLAAWRRFWRTLRADADQFAVYVVVRWILGFVAGIAAMVVLGLLSLPLLVVVAGFGLLGVGLHSAVPAALLVLLAVVAIPVVLALLVVGLFIQVVVQTFFGYYALLVLGDADPSLDLIPDRRAAVRPGD